MSSIQAVITVAIMVVGTAATRYIPFLLFPENRKIPDAVLYLGKALPYSVMGMLIVYCLRNVSVISAPFGIPEFIAAVVVVLLHVWKRNTLLSIGAGTVVYIILLHII